MHSTIWSPSWIGPLDRIWNNRKRREIEDILNASDPAHFQRVFLVGFLRFAVGLSEDEVCSLIKERARWVDYNEKITRQQVRSVYKRGIAERKVAERSEVPFKGTQCLSSSSPLSNPKEGRRWVGVENGAGFVLEWYRRSGEPSQCTE